VSGGDTIQSVAEFCGAFIISAYYILTAAHCVVQEDDVTPMRPEDFKVLVGEYNRDVVEGTERLHDVAEVITHERYGNGEMDGDIAILRLRTPIVFSTSIRPVCLPARQEVEEQTCTVSGWGTTQDTHPAGSEGFLLYVRVTIIPHAECTSPNVYGREVTANMLCAGDRAGGKDSCQGDSGGPLFCRAFGQFTQYGVISWGDGCGERNRPGVYARVYNFMPWIRQKTNGAFQLGPTQ